MIRLIHLSDIHITAPDLDWRPGDWFSKRSPGWFNYKYLGRKFRFRHADEVLPVLVQELRQHAPDRVIFSGDATALGFEAECARAASLLRAS